MQEMQREIFSDVEELTDHMISAPAEELPALTARRGELLRRAVEAGEKIRMAACGDPGLLAAAGCSCDVSDLPAELAGVFEAALRVRAAANRIRGMEADVLDRMTSERDSALRKLEAMNQSGHRVAADYKRAVRTGFPQFLQENGRKV